MKVKQLEEENQKLWNENNVSPQNLGVGNYSGIHDQPKGLESDLSRIIVPALSTRTNELMNQKLKAAPSIDYW